MATNMIHHQPRYHETLLGELSSRDIGELAANVINRYPVNLAAGLHIQATEGYNARSGNRVFWTLWRQDDVLAEGRSLLEVLTA